MKPSKKPKTLHRKQLFGGRMTAEEVHRAIALPGKKCPCNMQASVRAVTFAPLKDLFEKDPRRVQWMASMAGGQLPIVHLKYGKFVKLGETYSCDMCRPAMESALAKLPSWVLVDFDYGPGADKSMSQVPSDGGGKAA